MKSSLFYAFALMLCLGFRTDQFEHVYQLDQFLILYSTKGEHALPKSKQKDLNKNDVPDFIENIGLQFQITNRLYHEIFNMRTPLESPRYKENQVVFIKVSMKNRIAFNGVAYDGIYSYNYYDKQKGTYRNVKTLAVDINNDIKHTDQTPAHELMHLYQNGYTFFNVKWYTEGMARWAEAAMAKGTGKVGQLPTNAKERQKQVYDQTYKAASFWNALAKQTDPKGQMILPSSLSEQKYTDGYPVIEDHYFYGAKFLKAVLEALDKKDGNEINPQGLKSYFWEKPENDQADVNVLVWSAIQEACKVLDVQFHID